MATKSLFRADEKPDTDGRAVPYDKLSRGTKQSIDLQRRRTLQEAQETADAGDTTRRKVEDGVSKFLMASPLNSRSRADIGEVNAARDAREETRQRKLSEAKDLADYKDTKPTPNSTRSFYEKAPGRTLDVRGYARGGMVCRGFGKARGA